MSNYNHLKEVLNDIFELNKADLDFGIYRIMNQKRKQVNEFIEKQLPSDIKKALSETQSSDRTEIENELKTLKKNLENAGIVAEESPKYKSLSERLKTLENSDSLEQEVFSHLANFFRRYYKDGDFISMRRYKKDVYAIPYEGEEVKLHWANHDQYYIKSSENFKNYTFKTSDGKKVHFQLKEVSTEQNNNKSQGDVERKFAIYSELPIEENNNELIINFVYEPFSKATKQESLINDALEILSTNIPSTFTSIFALSPTEKNAKRTLLEKNLNDFVSKNSFDYFIHKDLGSFLNRELDFYIKNEVLYLDDVNTKQTEFFVAQLSKVKAIKAVSQKIIDFLAQIENFQKKLWLKKKFVISTDYCITLDKIPSDYYQEIIKNKEQLAEWKSLFDVDIQNPEQLVFEPFLVLDTKFFDQTFKDRLLAEYENLHSEINGTLISSENFQALNLLEEMYTNQIDVVYIDPPYNTESNSILYKNNFKHSSWLSLMNQVLDKSSTLYKSDAGVHIVAIDKAEQQRLSILLENIFTDKTVFPVSVIHNPGGTLSKNISTSGEYAFFVFDNDKESIAKENREDDPDVRDFMNTAKGKTSNYLRSSGKTCFYPVKVKDGAIVGFGEVCDDNYHPNRNEIKEDGTIEIYPIDNDGIERKWVLGRDTVEKHIDELDAYFDSKTSAYKIRRSKTSLNYKSVWTKNEYSAKKYGTELLGHIVPITKEILPLYPKSLHLVKDCVDAGLNNKKSGIVLDYFGGSGTTGHASIKLIREKKIELKYLLIDMGHHFHNVLLPRICKVIYSDNWNNGKPQDKNGVSQFIKYHKLESHEDTLNNLHLINKAELDFNEKAKQEYLIQYMLELESRDHLFNLEMFKKPFDYQIKVTENAELKFTRVDIVETFNYLIGLYVSKVQRVKDIKVVEGTTRNGIKTLVIWRDLDTTTHEEVEKLLRRFYDSQRTKEFQQIFINGDHHLENFRSEGDQFKIKLIEETFFKKMFNEIEL